MPNQTDMTHPVTCADLDEVVAKLATKTELADAVAKLATKADMDSSFAAVAAQMRELTQAVQKCPRRSAKFDRGERDQFSREIRLLDDKYADLPARVKKLEEQSTPQAKRRKCAS